METDWTQDKKLNFFPSAGTVWIEGGADRQKEAIT
jgi:hypothetical protein